MSHTQTFPRAVVCMTPFIGHLYPTLTIAKQLRANGWQIQYIGFEHMRDAIAREGFAFVAIGVHEEVKMVHRHLARLNVVAAFKLLRTFIERTKRAILDYRPDLSLIDADMPYVVAAVAAETRVVLLHATFRRFSPSFICPPDCSSVVPSTSGFSKLAVGLAWIMAYARERINPAFLISWLLGPERWVIKAARATKQPTSSAYPGCIIDLPSLVLCPRALDFPRKTTALYLRDVNDVSRNQPAAGRTGGSKSILCSLGTNARFYPWAGKFFSMIVRLGQKQPDWGIHLHCGSEFLSLLDTPNRPANVILYAHAPIFDLLRTVDVMITHGGLGTLKECFEFEVPMVVCPCKWDQFGNAARVKTLGIGVSLPVRRVTVDKLESACHSLMHSDHTTAFRTAKANDTTSLSVAAAVDQLQAWAKPVAT